jgi:hypothetical protein
MTARRVRLALGLTLCLAAGVARAQSPNDILPEAPAKAVVVRACTTCHQAAQVVVRRHTQAEWDELVGKMIDRGARLTDDEQDQVIAYLAKYFGPTPTRGPAAAPGGASIAVR